MKKEIGNKEFDIWLLGDSNPKNWESILESPFDPRHPVRHNIWTPVIEVIQGRVFGELRKRIDTSQLYIRNAIEDVSKKPKQNAKDWSIEVEHKISELQNLVEIYQPSLLFSFGAFSFEFGRRVMNEERIRAYRYWGSKKLGVEFRERIKHLDDKGTNLIPLLHRVVSGGKFLKSQNYFCGVDGANYFALVGNAIADEIIEKCGELNIWIE